MQPITEINPSPRIERGMTKMYVPNEGEEVVFAYPSTGPGDYISVGKEILSRGQKVPTGSQTASLLHSAYCSDSATEPEFQNIQNIIRNRWLWVFNRNLWTSDGVYVVHDSDVVGRNHPLNENELEKMISEGKEINGVVFGNGANFARKGYKLESQDSHSLAKNGFIVASYGIEGADKLAEVSSKFGKNPFVHGLNIDKRQKAKQTLSALDRSWSFGNRLDVNGYDWNDSVIGHSFGVCTPSK